MTSIGAPRLGHGTWSAIAAVVVLAVGGCQATTTPEGSSPRSSAAIPSGPVASAAEPAPSATSSSRVILLGRIVTMAEPDVAEAIALDGDRVLAVGSRDEVMALADGETRVIELGDTVAYPGFIDAHSHWIGDREHYGVATAEEAMDQAVRRGWTSIAELWVNQERLLELEDLDRSGLPLRVDAYLAANHPAPDGTHLGEWYLEREPGAVSERLRVQGVKFTIDNGWGSQVWWQPEDLAEDVEHAHDAGWQIAVHTVSTSAHEMVLDAFERALDGGPNATHHRIEHAIQVTDAQLERFVDLGIVVVIHPDGGPSDWVLEDDYLGNLGEDTALLARWRDFVDAGLHVANGVDAPWIFPGLEATADIGRPFDAIAGATDGRGRANPETPPWVLEQLLTPEQALKTLTVDAAYAINDEASRGHLSVGTLADITILSRDVTAGTPDEIRATEVLATIVGGRAVYCATPELCP